MNGIMAIVLGLLQILDINGGRCKKFICATCDSSRASSTTIADGPQPSASSGDPCVDFRWSDVDGETLYQQMRDGRMVMRLL